MSDMCIPDLVELNSYWQKAVEDAIRDTVKGEEKLLNALRNRKKINEKLKTFGLNPVFSVWPLEKEISPKSPENPEPPLESEESTASEEESLDLLGFNESKSSGTPLEDEKQKSPMRSLFGNRSLEKIKRSQNSFNCEPMGEGGNSEDVTESEKTGEAFPTGLRKNQDTEKGKNIQWLHVRDDRDFQNSNSESSSGEGDGENSIQLLRHPFPRKRRHLWNESSRGNSEKKLARMSKKFKKQGLLSGNESKSTVVKQKNLKQRLELALAKREILNKKRKLPRGPKSKVLIKVSRSTARVAEERTKGKKQLSSFIRFYLQMYKQLCLKVPVKRIAEEAAKKWRAMGAKEKAERELIFNKNKPQL